MLKEVHHIAVLLQVLLKEAAVFPEAQKAIIVVPEAQTKITTAVHLITTAVHRNLPEAVAEQDNSFNR